MHVRVPGRWNIIKHVLISILCYDFTSFERKWSSVKLKIQYENTFGRWKSYFNCHKSISGPNKGWKMREISSKMPCCFAHVGVSTSLASTSLVGAKVMEMEEMENEKKRGGVKGFRNYSLLWETKKMLFVAIDWFICSFCNFTLSPIVKTWINLGLDTLCSNANIWPDPKS